MVPRASWKPRCRCATNATDELPRRDIRVRFAYACRLMVLGAGPGGFQRAVAVTGVPLDSSLGGDASTSDRELATRSQAAVPASSVTLPRVSARRAARGQSGCSPARDDCNSCGDEPGVPFARERLCLMNRYDRRSGICTASRALRKTCRSVNCLRENFLDSRRPGKSSGDGSSVRAFSCAKASVTVTLNFT